MSMELHPRLVKEETFDLSANGEAASVDPLTWSDGQPRDCDDACLDTAVSDFGSVCAACNAPVSVPWVRCFKCNPRVDICSRCFSYGAEFGQHESDHPYTVVTFSFPLYEVSWTAAEELELLEAIQECGMGNWQAVAQRMQTKSDTECEGHYLRHYVDNPHPLLPEFPDKKTFTTGAPVVFKLSDNPPRPPEGSNLWSEMAGYSAARSDFSEEHDNFIELDIAHLDTDDWSAGWGDTPASQDVGGQPLTSGHSPANQSQDGDGQPLTSGDRDVLQELKYAVIDVYRNCLMERQRRKKIVRDYGLINLKRLYVFFWRKFDPGFSMNPYRPFMRLFPPETFDKFLESLDYERQVKQDLARLQEYRRHGLRRLHSAKWYRVMKQRRQGVRGHRGLLAGVLNHVKDEMSCQAWLAKQATITSKPSDQQTLPNAPRKAAPPLYIEDLPGYETLSTEERELCATVRLVPQAYLDFSKLLLCECRKQGYLKLAQARTLIKIDVNKTRKIYNFLVQQGLINKDLL